MSPAFLGVDAVGKRKHRLGEAVVVLYGNFHQDIVLRLFVVEGQLLHDAAVPVHIPDQVGYTAVEVVSALHVPVALLIVPVAHELDFKPLVEERNLLEVTGKYVEVVLDVWENLLVGPETYDRTVAVGPFLPGHRSQGLAPGVFLNVQPTTAADFGPEVV